jgi:hypothetical protein
MKQPSLRASFGLGFNKDQILGFVNLFPPKFNKKEIFSLLPAPR